MGSQPGGDRERRWRGMDTLETRNRPPRALLAVLLLASATVITLDYRGGEDSPVEPARAAVGEVFGPVESVTAAVVRPLAAVPSWFHGKDDLREEIAVLQAENSELRTQVATSGFDRNRLEEYDGLTRTAEDLGHALVPARVVAYGPSQSFNSTVTIDAGSEAGITPDMTVVNNDGLVGRVLRVTRTTATVLLVLDADSVVGGRLGESMEVGMVHGRGSFADSGALDLRLVDTTVTPTKHESIVTWGGSAGPYVAGVPIGRVTEVYSSIRESSRRAVVEPFVDFSTLDVVGVAVPSGTTSDRAVVESDGSLR